MRLPLCSRGSSAGAAWAEHGGVSRARASFVSPFFRRIIPVPASPLPSAPHPRSLSPLPQRWRLNTGAASKRSAPLVSPAPDATNPTPRSPTPPRPHVTASLPLCPPAPLSPHPKHPTDPSFSSPTPPHRPQLQGFGTLLSNLGAQRGMPPAPIDTFKKGGSPVARLYNWQGHQTDTARHVTGCRSTQRHEVAKCVFTTEPGIMLCP